jgi:hypothetical protein
MLKVQLLFGQIKVKCKFIKHTVICLLFWWTNYSKFYEAKICTAKLAGLLKAALVKFLQIWN